MALEKARKASLLKASASHAECVAAACKEACEGSNEQCHDEVHKCLDYPECAVQDCTMTCGCGDNRRLLQCASKTTSPFAVLVAECVTKGEYLVRDSVKILLVLKEAERILGPGDADTIRWRRRYEEAIAKEEGEHFVK